ncbi:MULTISPECIES: hypothetical protein [Levilactobacillus]|uniref:hypothetical protein n=1 Tax=Levilactobacillus TaxID=2767886 RepID=UPI000F78FE55|nr:MULTISPECIES: hypothetical protein [Levilactobacillus]
MKVLAIMLITILTAGLVGGTIWLMLTLALAAWLEVLIGAVGLVLATVINLAIFWFLWPHPAPSEDDED